MHQRMAIRQAIMAQLAGRTMAGARVLAHPTEPWKRATLPVIGVYTDDEQIEDQSKTNRPREIWRDLDVVIVLWVASTQANPAVDALDNGAEQIEAAMALDPYLAGTVGLTGAVLVSTQVAIQDDEQQRADPMIGVVRLTYTAPYTFVPPPPTDLADYLRTGTTTPIEGTTGEPLSDLFDQRP
jgi:hypothetical protein